MNYLVIIAVIITSLTVSPQPEVEAAIAAKPVACHYFGYENAAKLLGTQVKGDDGGMTEDAAGRSWKCVFYSADEAVKDAPKLYFMLMKSSTPDTAKSAFENIRESNKKHNGFDEWPGVGDEAVVHTDASNFHFVMVRKGANTIRIKVNPARGITLDAVKSAAELLTAKL